jgi:hypothetical protein
MKFLYLDAAGDPGYPAPYGRSNTKYYVLAGLSIDPEKDWVKCREKLSEIVRKHFPNKENSPKELHYSDLTSRRKPFDTLSDTGRKMMADEIFDLILELKPVLFAIVVDKLKHRQKYSSPERPNILAIRFMVPRFSRYLKRISDQGILVYDSEERNINKELRNFLFEARDIGVVIQPAELLFYTQNYLDNLIETIFFVESHVSPVVQLADFCAHAIFLKYERGKTTRFNQIKNLFDSYQNVMYGLIEWPKRNG